MMKLQFKSQKHNLVLKSYDLYLLSPLDADINLSMNLNSCLLNCWGETFFTTATLKLFSEKLFWWHSFACIDRADLSTLSSLLKQDLCPLVRLRQAWMVLPKYGSSSHRLQSHRYTILLDLQFRKRGTVSGIPLITNLRSWLTSGHCMQPGALHFWPFAVVFFVLNCLFCTIVLPMELCFFIANMTFVSPISSLISSFKLCTTDLNSLTLSK